jgi:hypothetical protein
MEMGKKEKKIKVWITKYALTTGIMEKDVIVEEDLPAIACDRSTPFVSYYHGEGKEWHRTKESAINKAEEMRIRKIRSLRNQIIKLEKMSFE